MVGNPFGLARAATWAGQPVEQSADDWRGTGMMLAGVGALLGAVGSFFAVSSQRREMEAHALSYEFEGTMAALDARAAEADAQAGLDAAATEVGALTLAAGAERASRRASLAARGITTTGSAAEVALSADVMLEADKYTIARSARSRAAADRVRAVNATNRSRFARVSANNARRSARALSPWSALSTSLLTDAASFGSSWALTHHDGGRQ